MVYCQIALLEYRGELKLVGGHLIMACLTGDSELQSLNLKIFHKGLYTIGDGSEIVIVHLLILGTFVAHQRTTCHDQVRTGRVESLVYEEILLFPTQVHLDLLYIVVKELAYIGSRLAHCVE